MFKRLLAFALFFVMPLVALAGSGYSLKLVTSSYDEIAFEFELEQLDVQTVYANDIEFTRVSIEGAGVVGSYGFPGLPAIRKLVWVPEGATVSIEVEAPQKRAVALEQMGFSRLVYPVQYPRPKMPGAQPQFAFKPSAYEADEFYCADAARIIDEGYIRARRFVAVEIRPVAYNPGAGTLVVRDRILVRLKLDGADTAATEAMLDRYDDYYHWAMARLTFINPDGFDSKQGVAIPQTPMGFLVIASPQFIGDEVFESYLSWRTQMGYHVTVLSTDETTSDPVNIKGWIAGAYEYWDVPPVFVLLVGDTDSIGYFEGYAPSDLYFATVAGDDYFPDIFVGRISARSETDLHNQLNKLLFHENVLWTVGDDWILKASFMASRDNFYISEGTHNFVIDTFLTPAGYTSDKFYSHTYHAKTAQVIAAINEGRSLLIYSGHGSEDSWVDGPPMDASQVRSLVNPVFPLVCSFACLTGSYHIPECFGETWVRTAAGAVAFWGSSVPSYWDEDDVLERKQFEGFFANPAGVNLTWIEGMFQYGKIGVYEQWGDIDTVRRYFEMYNCLGDPSLDIWTAPPVPVAPEIPQFVDPAQPLTINVGLPRALVSVTTDGVVLASAFTDETGVATLQLDPNLPGGTELLITVTGHNIRPFQAATVVGSEPSDDDDTGDDDSGGGGGGSDEGESAGCGCYF